MNKKLAGLFAGPVMALIGTMAQANLLDDPGFEAATGGSQTSNSDWTLTANLPDGIESSAQFQTAPWASNPAGTPGTGVWLKTFEGNQAPGDTLADAELSQTIAAPVGGDYALSFFARREENFSAGAWMVTLTSSGTGGSASINLLGVALNDALWHQYNVNLTGVTMGDLLTVSALMTDGADALANPQSAFFDDFALISRNQQQVPAPATLTLLALGMAAIGYQRRRRVKAA